MKFHRINALLIRHLYLYRRSLPRVMDIFYWPVMELLVWGFLSVWLQNTDFVGEFNMVSVLLGALIFWNFLTQSQKSVSVAFLEDVWERNLLNVFVTPLKPSEFLTSTAILGAVRILLVAIVMGALAALLYSFDVFQFGILIIPFVINLLIFGWTIGVLIIGILLRYGTQAQILAFGLIVLFQPLSAVFYPVSALPSFLQSIALALPSAHVFEGMRAVLQGDFPFTTLGYAFLTNAIYLVFALWFFYMMFSRAKKRGLLLKLE